MNNTLAFFLTLLMTCCATILSAQSNKSTKTPQEDLRRAQSLKVKKYDLYNDRTFKPFFFAEANLGLVGTFSKDQVYTVSAPASFGLGYRMNSNISFGLRYGRSVYNSYLNYYDLSFDTHAQTTFSLASFQCNAHLPIGLRGEAYGGFGLAYQDTKIEALESSQDPEKANRRIVRPQQGVFPLAQIGARYAISPQISLQGELSYGLSNLSLGVRYRLR